MNKKNNFYGIHIFLILSILSAIIYKSVFFILIFIIVYLIIKLFINDSKMILILYGIMILITGIIVEIKLIPFMYNAFLISLPLILYIFILILGAIKNIKYAITGISDQEYNKALENNNKHVIGLKKLLDQSKNKK